MKWLIDTDTNHANRAIGGATDFGLCASRLLLLLLFLLLLSLLPLMLP